MEAGGGGAGGGGWGWDRWRWVVVGQVEVGGSGTGGGGWGWDRWRQVGVGQVEAGGGGNTRDMAMLGSAVGRRWLSLGGPFLLLCATGLENSLRAFISGDEAFFSRSVQPKAMTIKQMGVIQAMNLYRMAARVLV